MENLSGLLCTLGPVQGDYLFISNQQKLLFHTKENFHFDSKYSEDIEGMFYWIYGGTTMPRKRSKPIILKYIPNEDIDSSGNVSQMSYLGVNETLKATIYKYKLVCPCGNPRFYKSQDKKQVEEAGKCKPCLRKIRLSRRKRQEKVKAVTSLLEKVD
jgi:hypothetical protein